MMTSTSGSASSSRIAAATSDAARSPCTAACRTRKLTDGQRSCALRSTSFSASRVLAGDQPDAARAGTAAASCGRRRTAPRTRAARAAARAARAGRRARRAACSSTCIESVPPLTQNSVLTSAMTWSPCLNSSLSLARVDDQSWNDRVTSPLEVLELAEDGAVALVPLGELALDPDGAEPLDVALDLAGDDGDRPRRLGRRRARRRWRGRGRASVGQRRVTRSGYATSGDPGAAQAPAP